MDPIAIWETRYPYEESIHGQEKLLLDLRREVGSANVIQRHLGEISSILDRLPAGTSSRYRSWVTAPGSYRYGAEAHYQKRLMALLLRLADSGFPIDDIPEVICARQTIYPSGFNATPRIARLSGVSFVIVPAPTTYWLYVICTMIAQLGTGQSHNDRQLNLYLRYLTAARSFERWATPLTAHSLDHLVDEIVHRGKVEDVDDQEPAPSALAMNMVSSVEDFFLAHELAHLILGHGDDGSIDAEAAADRKALEMLRGLDPSKNDYFETPDLLPRHFPQLGYLTLRMWTAARLVAEQRVLPWVCDPADVVAQHGRIGAIWEARQKQAQLIGILDTMEAPPALHKVANGLGLLVGRINSAVLPPDEIERIVRLARSLAEEDYTELVERYRIQV